MKRKAPSPTRQEQLEDCPLIEILCVGAPPPRTFPRADPSRYLGARHSQFHRCLRNELTSLNNLASQLQRKSNVEGPNCDDMATAAALLAMAVPRAEDDADGEPAEGEEPPVPEVQMTETLKLMLAKFQVFQTVFIAHSQVGGRVGARREARRPRFAAAGA